MGDSPERRLEAWPGIPEVPSVLAALHSGVPTVRGLRGSVPSLLGTHLLVESALELQELPMGRPNVRMDVWHDAARHGLPGD